MTHGESTPPKKARAAVIIMGPTAAGKSALAIELARAFEGEIVNADSRQVYVGMDIGTDKVTPQRHPEPMRRTPSGLQQDSSAPPLNDGGRNRRIPVIVDGIPHYLIDILTPDQRYSAAEFRADAARIIGDIHRRGKFPIVVGGTGFFIRVLAGDRRLPDVPPDPPFRTWAETQPVEALAGKLKKASPALYAQVDNHRNRRRVTRYLEIAHARSNRQQATGRSAADHVAFYLMPSAWKVLKLALVPTRDVLRKRIEERVDQQLGRGLIAEVKRLVTQYGEDAPGLQAIAYREVFPHLHGETTLEETRKAIIRSNWRYARRQWTWLRKEPWLTKVSSPAEAHRAVTAWLRGFPKKETGEAERTLHPLAPRLT